MNKEDYNKFYIQGSDHYLIPKDVFDELFDEMENWKEEAKELKEKYLNAVADYETTMFEKEQLNSLVNSCQEEIRQLKKQVENCYCNRTDCSGRIKGSKTYDSLEQKIKNQQKEFIEYMNKTIEECNNYSKYIEKKTKELHVRSYGKTYIANEITKNEVAKKILKEILSKYKEIIGVKDER